MPTFDPILSTIPGPDARAAAGGQALLDGKVKPRGGQGRVEELARRFATLTGRLAR